jgi:cell wall-associated NlpC family hydrolase
MPVLPALLGRRIVAAVATDVLAFTAIALGSTSGMAAPEANIQQIQAQVRDLEMQAGAAHEEASRAADRLAGVRQTLESVKGKLKNQRNELNQTQAVLGDLARYLYASGGIDPALQLLLAEDPVEFLAQASVLDQVSWAQVAQIRQVQTARLRLAQMEAEALDQEAQAKALESEMSASESRVSDRLGQAQSILENLRADEREFIARNQAERAQQQREEARQAAAQVSGSSSNGSAGTGGGSGGGSRALQAVQYALAQVGEPYSFSARPPSSWDCSKLTSAAWGQSGVGLTALSYTQWDQTKRIPVSDIQPGDLVFYFGRGAHHVAMYVGNGKMVSASNPSDGVEIINFLGPWYKERFSGVGRVIR